MGYFSCKSYWEVIYACDIYPIIGLKRKSVLWYFYDYEDTRRTNLVVMRDFHCNIVMIFSKWKQVLFPTISLITGILDALIMYKCVIYCSKWHTYFEHDQIPPEVFIYLFTRSVLKVRYWSKQEWKYTMMFVNILLLYYKIEKNGIKIFGT